MPRGATAVPVGGGWDVFGAVRATRTAPLRRNVDRKSTFALGGQAGRHHGIDRLLRRRSTAADYAESHGSVTQSGAEV